ncbi:hypothetical protein OHA41_12175 [Streptomyces sp. NBC_00342]
MHVEGPQLGRSAVGQRQVVAVLEQQGQQRLVRREHQTRGPVRVLGPPPPSAPAVILPCPVIAGK